MTLAMQQAPQHCMSSKALQNGRLCRVLFKSDHGTSPLKHFPASQTFDGANLKLSQDLIRLSREHIECRWWQVCDLLQCLGLMLFVHCMPNVESRLLRRHIIFFGRKSNNGVCHVEEPPLTKITHSLQTKLLESAPVYIRQALYGRNGGIKDLFQALILVVLVDCKIHIHGIWLLRDTHDVNRILQSNLIFCQGTQPLPEQFRADAVTWLPICGFHELFEAIPDSLLLHVHMVGTFHVMRQHFLKVDHSIAIFVPSGKNRVEHLLTSVLCLGLVPSFMEHLLEWLFLCLGLFGWRLL
mmetsp:Transcript_4401/g.8822  ORF Transcript_4401/g.8822 Transcript_4401/m.8822 type:complete len:297 (+) Transcript_4401:188-1078(+)